MPTKKRKGRSKSVEYAGLNIVLHPHETPMVYVDFLFFIQNEIKLPIPIGNNTSVYLYNLKEIVSGQPLKGLTGTLLKCTEIDIKEWFDLNEKEIADESAVINSVKIPPNYLANAKFFDFVFFPDKHLLVTEVKDSHGSTKISVFKKYFDTILKRESFTSRFKSGHVTAITDDSSVESILQSDNLIKLDITVYKPNPDDLSSVRGRIMGNLSEIRAKKLQIVATAEANESLIVDQQLEDYSRVAADNGEVEAQIIINGKRRTVNTSSYPQILKESYYPSEIAQQDFLLAVANKFKDQI